MTSPVHGRTLVVDDEEDMRALLRAVINAANDGLRVECEAVDGQEAVDKWRSCDPDLVVIDQRMPGMSGLAAAQQILQEKPSQRIVLFSAFLDESLRKAAREIGIKECLSKDRIGDLPAALWALAS
jgi:two-component system, chemotaxis family, chemotaxis protein CheY